MWTGPRFVSAGTAAPSTTSAAPAWGTHQTDDVALLVVESAHETIALSDAQGFVEVLNSPQGIGTVGGANGAQLSVFWCRATSAAMAAPTIAAPGDHVQSRIFVFRDCVKTGTPYSVTAGDAVTSDTAIAIPGATITVPYSLIVMIASTAFDNSSPQLSGGFTNADLAKVATLGQANTNLGNGGGFAVGSGEKELVGAYGSTTGTFTNAQAQGHLSIALMPPPRHALLLPARFGRRGDFRIRAA